MPVPVCTALGFAHTLSAQPPDLPMPDILVGSQIFDLAFHPTSDVVYAGLLNGKVKAFTYDEQGAHSAVFDLRISKRSCRGLALSPDGSSLYAVGKNRTLQCVTTTQCYVKCVHLRAARKASSTQARAPCPRNARASTSELLRHTKPAVRL